MSTEAFVYDAIRTPRGRGKAGKGALSGIHSQELMAQADTKHRHFLFGDLPDGRRRILDRIGVARPVRQEDSVGVELQRGHRRLHLPGQGSPIVIERAAVRWVGEKDFGLQFMSIPSSERERLGELLQWVA